MYSNSINMELSQSFTTIHNSLREDIIRIIHTTAESKKITAFFCNDPFIMLDTNNQLGVRQEVEITHIDVIQQIFIGTGVAEIEVNIPFDDAGTNDLIKCLDVLEKCSYSYASIK